MGVIGTGDEGSVLLGAINPKYIAVKAIADIRPFNQWRAFFGDYSSNEARKARPGLMSVYGWKSETEAKKHVKVYGAYAELLAHAKEDGIEAIVIALPLHLHAAGGGGRDEGRAARADREADGPHGPRVQGNGPRGPGDRISCWPPATNATTTSSTTTRWR